MSGEIFAAGAPALPAVEALAEEIARRCAAVPNRRFMVAIAGPPGVGKSTFSEALRGRLNALAAGSSQILAMDGFHYDDTLLDVRGERARKGAPHTFDVDGLGATLARIRPGDRDVAVPVFDRAIEIARAGARIVEARTPIILVEGNYLLLDDPRWAPLRGFFDLTVMLDAPFALLDERLRHRWADLSDADLAAKMDGNDLPNARLVIEGSIEPDIRIPAPLHRD